MKKSDGWHIFIGNPKDFENKDAVTVRCLEIANAAQFPTDYQDMYEHLFENEDGELFVVMNDSNEIYGFATCDNMKEHDNTYLHGIIIHPVIQGMGFSVKLLEEIVKKDGNTFLTARTHNPRVYEMMSRVAYDGIIYPNLLSKKIPEIIWKVISSHTAMDTADKDLIVRDAYPDEKVIQAVKKDEVHKIFEKLNPTDAQVIVVCTKKNNLG